MPVVAVDPALFRKTFQK